MPRILSAEVLPAARPSRLLRPAIAGLLATLLLAAHLPARAALAELDDSEMTDVTGEGLTFAWSEFRMLVNPSSYFEQLGSTPAAKPAVGANGCSATGQNSNNYNCWRRADLRWYGLNVSSNDGSAVTNNADYAAGTAGLQATTWTAGGTMTQCANSGIYGLGCPRGGPIANFAAHDNPYILRVMKYAGDGSAAGTLGTTAGDVAPFQSSWFTTYQGQNGTGDWSGSATGTGSAQTVLEWLAPSIVNATQPLTPTSTGQPFYRLSFWGEIEVGRGGTNYTATGTCPSSFTQYCGNSSNILKSQTIIQGNAAGSVLRFFKFTQTNMAPGLVAPGFDPTLGASGCTEAGCSTTAGAAYNNRTLAIQYTSYLRGDLRFSVAQTEATPVLGAPVAFHALEGLYFRNAYAFVPMGQPFYQALTINAPRSTSSTAPGADGNFVIEMPMLPNNQTVYTRYYSLLTGLNATAAPSSWDAGYATALSARLYNLPVTGGTTPAYMPARTAATITNYADVNPNYRNTHGLIYVGDWYICQGVGCRLPLTANSGAQADAGIGRNAWNSQGDGLFFYGLTAYNAYSYRTTARDVRRDQSCYTPTGSGAGGCYNNIAYMSNYAACTPANGTSYTQCGYGGAYRGAGGGTTAKTLTSGSIPRPEDIWLLSGTGTLGNGTRNYIAVPANSAINLGDLRIEGMQLNYLRITTLGATN